MHLQGWDVPHQEKQPLVSALPPIDPSAHQTATKKTTIKDASMRFFIFLNLFLSFFLFKFLFKFFFFGGGGLKQIKEKGNK